MSPWNLGKCVKFCYIESFFSPAQRMVNEGNWLVCQKALKMFSAIDLKIVGATSHLKHYSRKNTAYICWKLKRQAKNVKTGSLRNISHMISIFCEQWGPIFSNVFFSQGRLLFDNLWLWCMVERDYSNYGSGMFAFINVYST